MLNEGSRKRIANSFDDGIDEENETRTIIWIILDIEKENIMIIIIEIYI